MKRVLALVAVLLLAAWAVITSPAWLPPLPDPFAEPFGDL